MVEYKIKGRNDVELYCTKNETDEKKCVVVIVHGFAEHSGRYNYTADKLADSGCVVYRFDNRGHGKSGGKKMDIESYEDFIEDADIIVEKAKNECLGLPIFMLGHSMGGFITASYGIKYPDKLKGQIFSGAATDKPLQLNKFLEIAVKIGSKILPDLRVKSDLTSMLCKDEKVIDEYCKDESVSNNTTLRFYNQFMIEGITWLRNNLKNYKYPCLVMHGREDKIIDCKSSQYFIEHISSEDKKLIIFEDMYHEILKEFQKDKVIDEINTWIGKLV